MRRVAGLTVVLLLFGCAAEGRPARPPAARPTATALVSAERHRRKLTKPIPAVTARAFTVTEPPGLKLLDELPYGVAPELQKPLGESRVAWARYLNGVHHRVHPIFTDEFLVGLAQLPADDPLNGELSTGLAIVLDPLQGEVEAVTVVRTSGIARFDESAVTAIRRAAPFGAAPDALRSEDGKVHFQWLLQRNLQLACSTYFMKPLLLKSAPSTAE